MVQIRGEWKEETKLKTGNQRQSRKERGLFSVSTFQMTYHLGFQLPPSRSLLLWDCLSGYWGGRRLSVYKKRGSRGRGKKADKLLNEEANYPAHHTSSCQGTAIPQAPWAKWDSEQQSLQPSGLANKIIYTDFPSRIHIKLPTSWKKGFQINDSTPPVTGSQKQKRPPT